MEEVKLEKNGPIAKITLTRVSRRNSMSANFVRDISNCIRDIELDPVIRVTLLTGEGNVFCSGGDLKDLLSENQVDMLPERNMLRDFMRLAIEMRKADKPIIAVVNGPAVGGAAALALASDLIIASDRARFHMGFVRIGLSGADVGMSYFLPRNVGVAKATELLLLGEEISAFEAERIGMINKVVPHEQLMNLAEEWARRIAEGPPVGISLTKYSINQELGMDMNTALEFETYIQSFAMRTKDHKIGINAFLNKRNPEFIGE